MMASAILQKGLQEWKIGSLPSGRFQSGADLVALYEGHPEDAPFPF
jgi:hypothetical protein